MGTQNVKFPTENQTKKNAYDMYKRMDNNMESTYTYHRQCDWLQGKH